MHATTISQSPSRRHSGPSRSVWIASIPLIVGATAVHTLASAGGIDCQPWTALSEPSPGVVSVVATSSVGIHRESLVASGWIQRADGSDTSGVVARVGSEWVLLAADLNLIVHDITTYRRRLLIAGSFTQVSGAPIAHLAVFDGSAWSQIPGSFEFVTGTPTIWGTFVEDDDLYVGGTFNMIDGVPHARIARWDGAQWHSVGPGLNGTVTTILRQDGTLIAGGFFDASNGVATNRIASFDGTEWHQIGDGLIGGVRSVVVHDGTLYAGGEFLTTGNGVPAKRVARFNGTDWEPVGAGFSGRVERLVSHEGDLFAVGLLVLSGDTIMLRIARLDADTDEWVEVDGGLNGGAFDAIGFGDSLVVGGTFTQAGSTPVSGIAAWRPCDDGLGKKPGDPIGPIVIGPGGGSGSDPIGPAGGTVGGSVLNDLAEMLGAFGGGSRTADLNGDGVVDGVDLVVLLDSWR